MVTYEQKILVRIQSMPYTVLAGKDYFLRFSDGEEIRCAFVIPEGGSRCCNIMSNSSRLDGGNSIENGLMKTLASRYSRNYYISSVGGERKEWLMPPYISGIREVPEENDSPVEQKIPGYITLGLNGGRKFIAKLDTQYQVQTHGHQWWNGVIVIQDHKILMLSNNDEWNGGHALSEKNKAYGFKYQWHFGSIGDLVLWKVFHYTDMYDIAGEEATEPTVEPAVQEYTKTAGTTWGERIEIDKEEACCEKVSTTRRKSKVVFKTIR